MEAFLEEPRAEDTDTERATKCQVPPTSQRRELVCVEGGVVVGVVVLTRQA